MKSFYDAITIHLISLPFNCKGTIIKEKWP